MLPASGSLAFALVTRILEESPSSLGGPCRHRVIVFDLHRVSALAATLLASIGFALGVVMPGASTTAAATTAAATTSAATTSAAATAPEAQLRPRAIAPLRTPALGIAGWPDGLGYWIVLASGGVVAAGGAQFYGSLAGRRLNAPVVGIAAAPTGKGYWLVEANGGVYGFGAARFYGSMAGHHLLDRVVGMAPTPDGKGYWLVSADGGVFAFGDARFWGSVPEEGVRISDAIGLVPTNTGAGYYVETPSRRYPFGAVYANVPVGTKDPASSPIVDAAAIFRGLCQTYANGTVVVYRTVAVYHTIGVWSEQLAIPRPIAIASTAVSRNLFVLDALGQVKVINGPGPVPVTKPRLLVMPGG